MSEKQPIFFYKAGCINNSVDERRKALVRDLVKGSCYLKREGSKYNICANPGGSKQVRSPIPRYPETKDSLVRLIKGKRRYSEANGF